MSRVLVAVAAFATFALLFHKAYLHGRTEALDEVKVHLQEVNGLGEAGAQAMYSCIMGGIDGYLEQRLD